VGGVIYTHDGTNWVDSTYTWIEDTPAADTAYYVAGNPGYHVLNVNDPSDPNQKLVRVDRILNGGNILSYDGATTSSVPASSLSGTRIGPVVTSRKIVDYAQAVSYTSNEPTNLPDPNLNASVLAGSIAVDTNTGRMFQLNTTRTKWVEIDPMAAETAYGVRDGNRIFVLDSAGKPTLVSEPMDISTGNKNIFTFTGGEWKSINNTKNSDIALSPSSQSTTTQSVIESFGQSIIAAHDYEDKFTVYDSRGNPYTMVVVFRKAFDRPAEPNATPPVGAESEWDWYAYYTDSSGVVQPQYGQGAGTLVFGDDGLLKRTYTYEPDPLAPNPNATNTPTGAQYAAWNVVEKVIDKNDPAYNSSIHDSLPTGLVVADFNVSGSQGSVNSNTTPATYASNLITLDFLGSDYAKTLGLSNDPIDGVTNFGSTSTTKVYAQDGYAMGVLDNWTIGGDGVIVGSYSNGRTLPIAQVALAMFANPQGLSQVGETCFSETINSGSAQIGEPQSNGAGGIVGNTIEMSNVDLSEEFVNLIRAQRGFQANTRVVTTSDQVLEELINMKR
jgi:flagellar hook-basal body protein